MFPNYQFKYFGRFLTSPYSFHRAFPKFPPRTPFVFGNFPPSINPLFHAHKSRSTWKVVVPHQTYACMLLIVYIYIKIPQPHSPIINGRGKFLAQSLRPCWLLGGIPPSITVWWVIMVPWTNRKCPWERERGRLSIDDTCSADHGMLCAWPRIAAMVSSTRQQQISVYMGKHTIISGGCLHTGWSWCQDDYQVP